MGDTWITNIQHFLDDEGYFPYDLPNPARNLANYLCSIVEAVTSTGKNKIYKTGIRCRRRPNHKRCNGEVLALIKSKNNLEIRWECPVCNDNGVISGWGGTLWDKTNKL